MSRPEMDMLPGKRPAKREPEIGAMDHPEPLSFVVLQNNRWRVTVVERGASSQTSRAGQIFPSQPQARPRKTKESGLGFSWISLDSFVRFGTFQRVMGDSKKKNCRPLRIRRPRR